MSMSIPATDKIIATFDSKYINSNFRQGRQFEDALVTIESGLTAGKMWNQEFQDAKHWISRACEHAQNIAADEARLPSRQHYSDARDQIGYAFSMNQAAKLSRELKKLETKQPGSLTPGMKGYVAALDQIDGLWKWLATAKPILVKGRKPNVTNRTEEEIEAIYSSTGHCPICTRRQKLVPGGAERQRPLVHHGYQMSDYNHAGYRMGKCFGTAKSSYEVSCEANKEFLVILKDTLRNQEAALKSLQASEHATLNVMEYPKNAPRNSDPVAVPYAKGTPQYEKARENEIRSTEGHIRQTKNEIEFHEARVANWKPAKLYNEITDPKEKILARMER